MKNASICLLDRCVGGLDRNTIARTAPCSSIAEHLKNIIISLRSAKVFFGEKSENDEDSGEMKSTMEDAADRARRGDAVN